jgi:hypothetical protein
MFEYAGWYGCCFRWVSHCEDTGLAGLTDRDAVKAESGCDAMRQCSGGCFLRFPSTMWGVAAEAFVWGYPGVPPVCSIGWILVGCEAGFLRERKSKLVSDNIF